jgi:hypothetical protein
MKRLAARDFEDLLQVCTGTLDRQLLSDSAMMYLPINPLIHLQCAIPVFEGLLESRHNRQLMKLLYRTAEWHALAKLRIHTDSSLTLLEKLTVEFGQLLRKFRDITCSTFSTVELRNRREIHTKSTGNELSAFPTSVNALIQGTGPAAPATSSEAAARSRLATQHLKDPLAAEGCDSENSPAQAEKLLAGTGKYAFKLGLYFSVCDAASEQSRGSRTTRSGRKPMVLNLHTIKLHFLGDYVQHIRTFGTTDSYSTQLVCACFCLH